MNNKSTINNSLISKTMTKVFINSLNITFQTYKNDGGNQTTIITAWLNDL